MQPASQAKSQVKVKAEYRYSLLLMMFDTETDIWFELYGTALISLVLSTQEHGILLRCEGAFPTVGAGAPQEAPEVFLGTAQEMSWQ
jgi:hypothetical protein